MTPTTVTFTRNARSANYTILAHRTLVLMSGKSVEDAETIFDDLQISYNNDRISYEDYIHLSDVLSPYIS